MLLTRFKQKERDAFPLGKTSLIHITFEKMFPTPLRWWVPPFHFSVSPKTPTETGFALNKC